MVGIRPPIRDHVVVLDVPDGVDHGEEVLASIRPGAVAEVVLAPGEELSWRVGKFHPVDVVVTLGRERWSLVHHVERNQVSVTIVAMLALADGLDEVLELPLAELAVHAVISDGGQLQTVDVFKGEGKLGVVPAIVDDGKNLIRYADVDEDEKHALRAGAYNLPVRPLSEVFGTESDRGVKARNLGRDEMFLDELSGDSSVDPLCHPPRTHSHLGRVNNAVQASHELISLPLQYGLARNGSRGGGEDRGGATESLGVWGMTKYAAILETVGTGPSEVELDDRGER